MSAVAVDTHVLLWFLSNSPKLSAPEAGALDEAERLGQPIYVPAIVVVELRYLVEKFTLTETEYQDILTGLSDPATLLTIAPLELAEADATSLIPRAAVPDMPDQIIAATALALGLPLLTRDAKIRSLTNITTIW